MPISGQAWAIACRYLRINPGTTLPALALQTGMRDLSGEKAPAISGCPPNKALAIVARGRSGATKMSAKTDELQELVHTKIENLRPKLLDLSRRNPLLSTKLGPRSNSHIRAVDELPDVLFYKLKNGQDMSMVPLPPIEADPRDEQTDTFREALANARLVDEIYLSAMEAAEHDADDYLDKARSAERGLKDRIREQLGLAPRPERAEINLTQHARNNGISPAYELPDAADENEDGRHTDDAIQTLLLPDDLERKLNAIITKSRTWIQETGINVLHLAFGFLEWSENDQDESSFAPLVLLPIELSRIRTPQGPKYSIKGTGDEPELNAVLMEKLRIDFSIEMPGFDGSLIEAYFANVAKILPKKKKNWRVRRQVAVGVFPSARMAMYHDLDPKQPNFPQSEIVRALLAGSDASGASPFADEYEVDKPEVEFKVPCLVMDADSSQYSALVDIGDGRNLAIEGPPGTGKSQTIVNAIAAALSKGKKVLFVAEKLAALNVVKARLEAVGLGEFLLPLQAEKSTREQVIDSIRTRLDMRSSRPVRDYDDKLSEFRGLRKQICDYIDLITTEFADSGLTIHAILGKGIATTERLSGIPNHVLETCRLTPEMQTRRGFLSLVQLGTQLEAAHASTLAVEANWRHTRLVHPDRFTIEEACELATRASAEAERLADLRDALATLGLDVGESVTVLQAVAEGLVTACEEPALYPKRLLLGLLSDGRAAALHKLIEQVTEHRGLAAALSGELIGSPNASLLSKLQTIEETCTRASLETINTLRLTKQLEAKRKAVETARRISAALGPLVEACEEARFWTLDDIATAHGLCKEAGRDALLLKTTAHIEELAAFNLRTLCDEGLSLQQERDQLSTRIILSAEVPLEKLAECASMLRGAGAFSFLSPAYRAAKRLYVSLSPSTKYSRAQAVQTLDELINFRRKVEDHAARAQAGDIFSIHFRGLDTDYQTFGRLARHMQSVLTQFSSPTQASLREFLRKAPIGQLDLLPPLPATGAPLTSALLDDRITGGDKEVALLSAAIANLNDIGAVFKDTEIGPAAVVSARRRIKTLLSLEETISQNDVARELLGDRFVGSRTEVNSFHKPLAWARSVVSVEMQMRAALSRADSADAMRIVNDVLSAEQQFSAILGRLTEIACVERDTFLQTGSLRDSAAALARAGSDPTGLYAFATFATAIQEAAPHGVLPLIEERLRQGSLIGLGGQIEALATRQLAKAVYAQHGSKLTKYRGAKLDELRSALAQKDKEIIQLSRQQLRAGIRASAKVPPGNGVGKKSTWTDMALIENEVSKKQKFISVRDLTQRAGPALAELKPCWMMSPLAVAQYLPKGTVKFDICIIDEASQMPPESAIGALLRCDQAVVVGDTNQLPPSSFFKTMIDDEEADEDETVLNESVLEMANGAFRPARRLRWHYRSRHSGLIRFSNRLVYDDNLVVFPSATEAMSRMGVEFRSIKGRYKAGTNPVEAKAIIEAVIDFMHADPDRSLGVVTLNQKQRDLIMEEFEHAIASDKAVQRYIDTWKEKNDGLEEFFIKNLENVQGDERDVIFIGTVYGAQEPGARVMQRFGPINGLAGRRRLNVLFTRAKHKIVTFSSMTAADIQAEENANAGAYMLKRWLEYAASGVLDSGTETRNEPDSDFEVFVIEQIRSIGCTPVPQVGVAGYFVDIGVRHPEWPHGFILGVECDGATYHSAKSARDRDRLRQEVLEGLGWQLHRIWSTDWFNNPRQETERLRQVIGERLSALKAREHEFVPQPNTRPTQPAYAAWTEVNSPALFPSQAVRAPESIRVSAPQPSERRVEVGDTVRVRYLTDDKRTIKVTISTVQSDPSRGIIHHQTPVASALLGAEEGDEVEVLVGSYIRPAIVEVISKNEDGREAGLPG